MIIQDADKFHTPITIDVSKASKDAIKRVEEVGGTV